MRALYLFTLHLIVCNYQITFCTGTSAYRDEVASGGKSDNPGVQATISPKGVSYLNRVIGDVINVVVPTMTIPDSHNEIPPRGYVDLSNMHIINFRAPKEYNIDLTSPNVATWTIKDMDIGMKGHANGKYGPIEGDGNFDATGYNINFKIVMAITNVNGHLHLQVNECEARAGSMDMNIYDFAENLIRLFENHKKLALKIIKPKLEAQLCKQMKKFLDNDMNDVLQKIPMKIPLNKNEYSISDSTSSSSSSSASTTTSKNVSKTEKQFKDALSKMFFDASLTRDPKFDSNRADFFSKGEVSYMGQGGTPFYPNSLDESSNKVDRMLYLMISDYVINSMMYQAFKNGLLNFNINKKDNPEFAMIFKSTCDELMGEFCLDSVLPELKEQYPNYDMEVQMMPIQAPAVIIQSAKSVIYLVGELKLVANKNSEHIEVIRTTFDGAADTKPTLENNMIKTNFTITKLQMKLLKSTLKKFDQKRLDVIADMLKIVMDVIGNAMISKGFPIPTMKEVRWVNPKMKTLDRKVLIETDVEANKDELVKLAKKAAAKTISKAVASAPSNNNNNKNNDNEKSVPKKKHGRGRSNKRSNRHNQQ